MNTRVKEIGENNSNNSSPAFCSWKRAPTRSEYLRNFSVQLSTHCSCVRDEVYQRLSAIQLATRSKRTSLLVIALLVKSLQHVVKHRSTNPLKSLVKSCICSCSPKRRQHCTSPRESVGTHLLSLNDPCHVRLLGGIELGEIHGGRWRSTLCALAFVSRRSSVGNLCPAHVVFGYIAGHF